LRLKSAKTSFAAAVTDVGVASGHAAFLQELA